MNEVYYLSKHIGFTLRDIEKMTPEERRFFLVKFKEEIEDNKVDPASR